MRYLFISRVKAKGNYYFYAYVYDNSNVNGLRIVHSLGKRDTALSKLSTWKKQHSEIPKELIKLGLKTDNLDHWKQKIKEVAN